VGATQSIMPILVVWLIYAHCELLRSSIFFYGVWITPKDAVDPMFEKYFNCFDTGEFFLLIF
jgi:hypothetical protein